MLESPINCDLSALDDKLLARKVLLPLVALLLCINCPKILSFNSSVLLKDLSLLTELFGSVEIDFWVSLPD